MSILRSALRSERFSVSLPPFSPLARGVVTWDGREGLQPTLLSGSLLRSGRQPTFLSTIAYFPSFNYKITTISASGLAIAGVTLR